MYKNNYFVHFLFAKKRYISGKNIFYYKVDSVYHFLYNKSDLKGQSVYGKKKKNRNSN